MRQWLGSSLFSAGMVLSIAIWFPLFFLVSPLGYPVRVRFSQIWCSFIVNWLRITCQVSYEIEGLDNIPSTPCIVLSNHQSTYETFLLPLLIPPHATVLKRELTWIPIFGWGLALMRPIAINRGSAIASLKQLVREGSKRLQAGYWILMYPEGTRTPPDQRVDYKIGAFQLAAKSGYPILPIAHNAGYFWPRKGFLKSAGVIRIVIGPLIPTQGIKAQELVAQTQAWISEHTHPK